MFFNIELIKTTAVHILMGPCVNSPLSKVCVFPSRADPFNDVHVPVATAGIFPHVMSNIVLVYLSVSA